MKHKYKHFKKSSLKTSTPHGHSEGRFLTVNNVPSMKLLSINSNKISEIIKRGLRTLAQCKEETKHGVKRTLWYVARVLQSLTQQCAKSIGGVPGSARKQANAVRSSHKTKTSGAFSCARYIDWHSGENSAS